MARKIFFRIKSKIFNALGKRRNQGINNSILDSSRKPAFAKEFQTRLVTLLFYFSQWFQVKAAPVLRKLDWALIRTSMLIVALSFVVASSFSTFAANFALNSVIPQPIKSLKSGTGKLKNSNSNPPENLDSFQVRVPLEAQLGNTEGPSLNELKKFILERNLFNSEGVLANEVDEKSGLTKTTGLDFASVACSDEKLPLEVTGIIYTGDPKKSFISMKDPKIPDADIYKPGDVIIEHEEYEVYMVNHTSVEFRKGDSKICVALKGFEKNKESAQLSGPGGTQAVKPENVELFEFDSAYITQEIGPGYANILNSAKLIPEVDGAGKVVGYKIIAITPGSLFDKMKLQNGDVIADVNGVSLRDASQGFKLYQSLQEEREITVGTVRGGEPMTRKVRVK